MFLLTAVVSLIGWLVFTLCSSAEKAAWCRDQDATATCGDSPQQRVTEPEVASISPLEIVTVSCSALQVAPPGGDVFTDAASGLPPGKVVVSWMKV